MMACPVFKNYFMSWSRSILTAICCYWLPVTLVQAEELPVTTPLYQCPTYLQLDTHSYALDTGRESVYDSPIEEMTVLKPEPVPDDDNVKPSFWDYGVASPKRPFYIRCYYKDTAHFLVIKAKGARRCTFTKETPTWCGE